MLMCFLPSFSFIFLRIRDAETLIGGIYFLQCLRVQFCSADLDLDVNVVSAATSNGAYMQVHMCTLVVKFIKDDR